MEQIVHKTILPSDRTLIWLRFGTRFHTTPKSHRNFLPLFVLILMLFAVSSLQATTYYTWTTGTSPSVVGNWWTANNGTGTHPANFTTSGDVFIIQNNMTTTTNWTVTGTVQITSGVTLTVTSTGTTLTVGSLTIDGGGTLTCSRPCVVNGASGLANITGTINLSGANRASTFVNLTLNAGAVWNYTATGTSTVGISGNFINNATTFTPSAQVYTLSGTGKTMSGTTTIPSVAITGTITNSGTLTVGTALSGAGTLTNGTSGILKVGGTSTITNLTATAAGNTVEYSGAAQTVKAVNYSNLTLSGSAAKTLAAGTTSIGGNLTLSGTATATGVVGITIGGNVTIGSGTTFTSGNFTHSVAGNWTNSGGTFTAGSGTIALNGSGVQSITSGGSSFNNLTINNTAGVTAGGDFTVNGILNLSSANASATVGALNMSTYTLTMGTSATTTGSGDVTGIVTRSIPVAPGGAGVSYTFGSQFTTINFQNIGTLPTAISVKITLGSAPSGKTDAILRTYDIMRTGAATGSFGTINLHYLNGELNGNTETLLTLWDYDSPFTPGSAEEHGKSNYSTTDKWVGISGFQMTYLPAAFSSTIWMLSNTGTPIKTWNGSVSSVWTNPSNWTPGATIPSNIEKVVIPNSTTTSNDPTVDATLAVGTLTIQTGGILNTTLGSTITVSGSTGAWSNQGIFNANSGTVIFTNAAATISGSTDFYNVTINSGAALEMGSGSTMRIGGTMTNNGTWNAAQLPGTTVEYNGAGQTVLNPNGATAGYYNLILSGSGTKTLPSGTMSVLGNFSNSVAFAPNSGKVSFAGSGAQSINSGGSSFNNVDIINTGGACTAASNLTIANLDNGGAGDVAAILDMAGNTLTTTTINNTSGTIKFSGASNGLAIGTGTVEYYGANQTVGSGTYETLTISAAGTKTPNGSTTVTTLNNSIGGTLDMAGNTLTATTINNTSGTIKFSGASNGLAIGTGTVVYYGAAQTVGSGTYSNLTLSGTDLKTISTATANGIFSIEGSATISASPTFGGSSTLQYNGVGTRTMNVLEWPATSGPSNLSIIGSSALTGLSDRTLSGNLAIEAASTLNVPANASLTVGGNITNSGTMILKCGDGTTGHGPATLLNSGTITGSANSCIMEQMLTGDGADSPSGRGWYISSPVDDASIASLSTHAGKNVWAYNESGHAYTSPTGTFVPKTGYVFRDGYSETRTFSGTSFNTGNQDITGLTLTETDPKQGFNLIGNPYPSYLDFDLVTLDNVDATIWYCITAGGASTQFATYNALSGGLLGSARYIPPMQSVWVKVTAAGTGSLAITNAMRSHQSTGYLRDTKLADKTTLRLNIDNGTFKDETLLFFSASALDEFDMYDSEKMTNGNASIPEICTFASGKKVAINGMSSLASTKVIPLNFLTGKSGTFTIKASEINNFESDVRIQLTDKELNKQQDLMEIPSYTFTSDATNTSDRFTLTFVKYPTNIDKTVAASGFAVQTNSAGNIQVQLIDIDSQGTMISLYNISGQRLFMQMADGITTTIGKTLPRGFYMIEVQKDGFKGLKKIVVNQ